MKRSIRLYAEKSGNTAYQNLIPLLVVSFIYLFSAFAFMDFSCLGFRPVDDIQV
jgi:hypothetical protein